MPNPKSSNNLNQSGIAHILILITVVVGVAAIGGLGLYKFGTSDENTKNLQPNQNRTSTNDGSQSESETSEQKNSEEDKKQTKKRTRTNVVSRGNENLFALSVGRNYKSAVLVGDKVYFLKNLGSDRVTLYSLDKRNGEIEVVLPKEYIEPIVDQIIDERYGEESFIGLKDLEGRLHEEDGIVYYSLGGHMRQGMIFAIDTNDLGKDPKIAYELTNGRTEILNYENASLFTIIFQQNCAFSTDFHFINKDTYDIGEKIARTDVTTKRDFLGYSDSINKVIAANYKTPKNHLDCTPPEHFEIIAFNSDGTTETLTVDLPENVHDLQHDKSRDKVFILTPTSLHSYDLDDDKVELVSNLSLPVNDPNWDVYTFDEQLDDGTLCIRHNDRVSPVEHRKMEFNVDPNSGEILDNELCKEQRLINNETQSFFESLGLSEEYKLGDIQTDTSN